MKSVSLLAKSLNAQTSAFSYHVGKKECGNKLVLLFAPTFPSALSANWLGKKLKLQALGSFPYSSYTQTTILSTKASREYSAKFKRRAEWADSYQKKYEKTKLWGNIYIHYFVPLPAATIKQRLLLGLRLLLVRLR